MGRPRAAHSTCDFVVSLADWVTVFSDHPYDWVARKGRYAIFELLRNLAPMVQKLLFYCVLSFRLNSRVYIEQSTRSRENTKSARLLAEDLPRSAQSDLIRRGGITEAQLNKNLEMKGFRRVRVRMNCIVRYFTIVLEITMC